MNDNEERAYMQGNRAAWQHLLSIVIKELGYEGTEIASLIAEREGAIAILRNVCATHGDSDWDETLHLSDIIDKHLSRHLEAMREKADLYDAMVSSAQDLPL